MDISRFLRNTILILLFFTPLSYAQQYVSPALEGSSGFINSLMATTYRRGYLGFSVHGIYNTTKMLGNGGREHLIAGVASLTYGLSDDVELSSCLYVIGQGILKYGETTTDLLQSGFGHSELAAKVRIPFQSPQFDIAARLALQIPMGADFTVHPSYPFDTDCYTLEVMALQSLILSDHFRIHLNEGYRWRGLRSEYTGRVDLWRTNVCASYRFRENLLGYSEVSSALEMDDKIRFSRDRLVFTQGIQYLTPWKFNLNLATNIRLNKKRLDGTPTRAENWRVLFGISFAFQTHQPDRDGDGIPDDLDLEPNTPSGWPVDSKGRSLDSDGDGVPDGIDLEQNTRSGALVDKSGRSIDSDKDGVPDGIDQEPNTITGAIVNVYGVAVDSDGDGIPDGIDVEPNTPKGVNVDAKGKAIPSIEFELLTKGLLRVNKIYFDVNKADIKPESYAILNEIGHILENHPELIIQIAGHTDATGTDEFNYKLSIDRANSVRNYLLNSFTNLYEDKLTVIGYGRSRPVKDENTEEARTLNRRVEFKVLNLEQIQK